MAQVKRLIQVSHSQDPNGGMSDSRIQILGHSTVLYSMFNGTVK